MKELKKFIPLNVSSKFAICGLPLRMDTYKTCSFGCKYCFSNNREIMKFEQQLQVGDVEWLDRKLDKVLVDKKIDEKNFLEVLLSNNITFHCGGMSDPFQPCENQLKITSQAIDTCNKYKRHILFSTKSDTVYDSNISPDLHTFQLSVTGADTSIEPNVPIIDKRIKFFSYLKKSGFKVGIRIQPFIPNVSTLEIVKTFHEADNFTLEGIKIVPQNEEQKYFICSKFNLSLDDFTQMGLLNLKPEIRYKLYKPFIEYFKQNNISFSIADNDMHYLGTNNCCCGDALINKSTAFNTTSMIMKYGSNYTKSQIDYELQLSKCQNCKCNNLFTSNRQENCETVQEFYDKRFYRDSSIFSPKFLYKYRDIIEEQSNFTRHTLVE